MKKWKHTIYGRGLRENVVNMRDSNILKVSDVKQTLELLKYCYNQIQSRIDEDEWEIYFGWPYDIVVGDIEILENWSGQFPGFEDLRELVDDRLFTFYDLCDEHRIWISVYRGKQLDVVCLV